MSMDSSYMTQSKVFDQTFVLSIRFSSGVVRGGQPLTGVQGCPLVLSLSLAPPQAARKKKEKGFFGATPNPGKGLAALCNPA